MDIVELDIYIEGAASGSSQLHLVGVIQLIGAIHIIFIDISLR